MGLFGRLGGFVLGWRCGCSCWGMGLDVVSRSNEFCGFFGWVVGCS